MILKMKVDKILKIIESIGISSIVLSALFAYLWLPGFYFFILLFVVSLGIWFIIDIWIE